MKLRKGLLTCIMMLATVLVCLLIIPTEANAATEGDYTYTVYNGKATITDYNGSGGDVTIPSTLGGCPVTTIGDNAFAYCSSLTGVTIPDSVTTIGDAVFFECYYLTNISIPDSITNIGGDIFNYCDRLII